jgi:hypothetical protein
MAIGGRGDRPLSHRSCAPSKRGLSSKRRAASGGGAQPAVREPAQQRGEALARHAQHRQRGFGLGGVHDALGGFHRVLGDAEVVGTQDRAQAAQVRAHAALERRPEAFAGAAHGLVERGFDAVEFQQQFVGVDVHAGGGIHAGCEALWRERVAGDERPRGAGVRAGGREVGE